jgi:hypothetical protein
MRRTQKAKAKINFCISTFCLFDNALKFFLNYSSAQENFLTNPEFLYLH